MNYEQAKKLAGALSLMSVLDGSLSSKKSLARLREALKSDVRRAEA